MLRKLGLLAILSIFSNAENIKIEKFNLSDIKKCSEDNKELLCIDNNQWFLYKNSQSFQDKGIPNCDNKLENMYEISEVKNSITKPKIETTKNDDKITTKQTYETEIVSSHKIGACKTDNQMIIKSENK